MSEKPTVNDNNAVNHYGTLEQVSVGVNWSSIRSNILFGLLKDLEPVDLDLSAAVLDARNRLICKVGFDELQSTDGALLHSGDDTEGDDEDDDDDNETITVNFSLLTRKAVRIVFFLNSFEKHDFSHVPYAKVRIMERVNRFSSRLLEEYDIAANDSYANYRAMFIGMFELVENGWVYRKLRVPVEAENLLDTLHKIQLYLRKKS